MPTCRCKSSGHMHANGCNEPAAEGKDGFCEPCFDEDRKVQEAMKGVLETKERKEKKLIEEMKTERVTRVLDDLKRPNLPK